MASRNLLTSCCISRKYCPLLVFITSTHLPVVTSPIFVSKVMWDEDKEKIRSESFTLLSSFAHLATLSFILSNNMIVDAVIPHIRSVHKGEGHLQEIRRLEILPGVILRLENHIRES